MKKIFTLILTCGLLTAASAQSNRHQVDKKGSELDNQSYGYVAHHQTNGNGNVFANTPYSHSDGWNYQPNDRRDNDGYGNSRDRVGDKDHDDRRGRYDGRGFDHGTWNYNLHEGRMKKKGLQIFFGFSSR